MINHIKFSDNSIIQSLIIIACFVFFSLSCRTVAPVIYEEATYTGEQLINLLDMNDPDIKTYSVRRMQINIVDDEENISLRGSLKVRRDSLIWFSVIAFPGIEAARILMTRDSIKILDRINKRYSIGSYDDPNKYLPFRIRFEMLQNIFFGSPAGLLKEYDLIGHSDKIYFYNNDVLTLKAFIDAPITRIDEKATFQFDFDRNLMLKEAIYHSIKSGYFVKFIYNSYGSYDGVNLPEDIDIYFVSQNIPFSGNFKFGGININDDIRFPFNIPTSYRSVN